MLHPKPYCALSHVLVTILGMPITHTPSQTLMEGWPATNVWPNWPHPTRAHEKLKIPSHEHLGTNPANSHYLAPTSSLHINWVLQLVTESNARLCMILEKFEMLEAKSNAMHDLIFSWIVFLHATYNDSKEGAPLERDLQVWSSTKSSIGQLWVKRPSLVWYEVTINLDSGTKAPWISSRWGAPQKFQHEILQATKEGLQKSREWQASLRKSRVGIIAHLVLKTCTTSCRVVVFFQIREHSQINKFIYDRRPWYVMSPIFFLHKFFCFC